MSAFERAWALVKMADQRFIEGGATPEDIARLRLWLYNEPDKLQRLVEEPDVVPRHNDPNRDDWDHDLFPLSGKTNREELLEQYGEFDALGQANTDHGHEMLRPDWRGNVLTNWDKPIYGEGLTLISLPNIFDNVQWAMRDEWDKKYPDGSPKHWIYHEQHPDYVEPPEVDWNRDDWQEQLDARNAIKEQNEPIKDKMRRDYKAYERNKARFMDNPENTDTRLIDELIRVINHEIGHTTQAQEEDEWKKEYNKYTHGDPNTGLMRDILMGESLATLFENPHQTSDEWKNRIADYGGMYSLADHHDMIRDVSPLMTDYFDRNPDVYRGKDLVSQEQQRHKDMIADIRARRAEEALENGDEI